MTTLYREPSRFRQFCSDFWNRHVMITVVRGGYDFRLLRLRWWPLAILLVVWSVANTLLLIAIMMGDATPSVTPNLWEKIIYAPFYFLFSQ